MSGMHLQGSVCHEWTLISVNMISLCGNGTNDGVSFLFVWILLYLTVLCLLHMICKAFSAKMFQPT
jgi:hypothetical protein